MVRPTIGPCRVIQSIHKATTLDCDMMHRPAVCLISTLSPVLLTRLYSVLIVCSRSPPVVRYEITPNNTPFAVSGQTFGYLQGCDFVHQPCHPLYSANQSLTTPGARRLRATPQATQAVESVAPDSKQYCTASDPLEIGDKAPQTCTLSRYACICIVAMMNNRVEFAW